MKKIIFVILLTILISPNLVKASWYNPSTWFKQDNNDNKLLLRISELEKKVSTKSNEEATSSTTTVNNLPVINKTDAKDPDLQAKISQLTLDNKSLKTQLDSIKVKLSTTQDNYAICKSDLAKNTNNSVSINSSETSQGAIINDKVTQIDTPFDYAKYTKTNIAYYVKNPRNFLGYGTQILVAKVIDFLPAGDRGVSNNYIEISDSASDSLIPEKMMVLIENDEDYTNIIGQVKEGDLVNVWGVGSPSQKFTTVGNSDSSSSYEPVITLQRIDRCMANKLCGSGSTISVFSKAK